ncbi:MAG: helix-turn-helix domain-containing protein, partial [Caldilineae bacterium]
MLDIGQLLRQTREARELSLADVEEQIRIRQRFLHALESGDWDALPNEVVARGFIRRYARFLGLDPDELLAQLKTTPLNSPVEAEIAVEPRRPDTSDYRPIELDMYEGFGPRPRWLRQVLTFILALVPVVVLGYLLVRFGLPLLLEQPGSGAAPPTVALPPEGQSAETPMIVVQETATTLPPTFTPTPLPTP